MRQVSRHKGWRLTGDPGDEPQGPKDSKRSESLHIEPSLLFHRSLHTADVIDEVHHDSEQPERDHNNTQVCEHVSRLPFITSRKGVCVCLFYPIVTMTKSNIFQQFRKYASA